MKRVQNVLMDLRTRSMLNRAL